MGNFSRIRKEIFSWNYVLQMPLNAAAAMLILPQLPAEAPNYSPHIWSWRFLKSQRQHQLKNAQRGRTKWNMCLYSSYLSCCTREAGPVKVCATETVVIEHAIRGTASSTHGRREAVPLKVCAIYSCTVIMQLHECGPDHALYLYMVW